MNGKMQLRKTLLQGRSALTCKETKNKSITTKFLDFFISGEFGSLFIYVSLNSEADTKSIIRQLYGKTEIYVPHTNEIMRSVKLSGVKNLEADKLGNIDMPLEFYDGQADATVVPLLGFNDGLYRIGYGGGFYDKYLQDYKGVKVGLAYDEQEIKFHEELHDVPLDIIITPTKIIRIEKQ